MRLAPRGGGLLVAALTVFALLGYYYVRFALTAPADARLAAMPEEEFAQNAALSPPQARQELPFELTPERYFELIQTYREPDYLLWEVEIQVLSGARERTSYAFYLRDGDDYLVEVYDRAGTLAREVRYEGGALTVRTPAGSIRSTAYPVYAPLPAMGMAGLPALAALSPSQIEQASLEVLDGRQVVYVTFTYPGMAMVEHYWVSLALGLPLRVETYEEGELVYAARTLSVETERAEEDLPLQVPLASVEELFGPIEQAQE